MQKKLKYLATMKEHLLLLCVYMYLNITNFWINKEWFISLALFLTFHSFDADLSSLGLPFILSLEVNTSGNIEMLFFILTRKCFCNIILNVGMKYISRMIALYLLDILSQAILMLIFFTLSLIKFLWLQAGKVHVAVSYTK